MIILIVFASEYSLKVHQIPLKIGFNLIRVKNSIINKNYDLQEIGFLDVQSLNNGILAGLVSITASCNNVEPWAAFCIGLIGSVIYLALSKLLIFLQVDDPIDAIPVHAGGGLWGILAVGFFDKDKGIFYGNNGKQCHDFFLELTGQEFFHNCHLDFCPQHFLRCI